MAVPVIAIIAAFSLFHTQPARLDDQGKVKLRVMSAVAPPTPELAREAVQRSELIQFALSKVAKVPAAAPSAGEETADDRIILAANNTPAGEHKSAVAPIAPEVSKPALLHRQIARKPVDIRPGKLRTAVQRRKLQVPKPVLAARPAAAGSWLTASLQWPVSLASKTIAPVKQSFAPVRKTWVRTVGQAGDALETLKKKIL